MENGEWSPIKLRLAPLETIGGFGRGEDSVPSLTPGYLQLAVERYVVLGGLLDLYCAQGAIAPGVHLLVELGEFEPVAIHEAHKVYLLPLSEFSRQHRCLHIGEQSTD